MEPEIKADPEAQGSGKHAVQGLWREKVIEMMRNTSLQQRAEDVFSVTGIPDRRFASLVLLEERMKGRPERRRVVEALRKKRENSYKGVMDKVRSDVYIQSILIFDFCTPKEYQSHVVWVPLAACIYTVIFFFMAGAYPLQINGCRERWMVTPGGLGRWLMFGNSWCLTSQAWTFDARYLAQWGGRLDAQMRHQGHRWVTYAFLHTGFPHYITNLLVWLTAGWHVERRYGTSRFLVLWLFSSLFGDMFGAICEDPCTVNVGFSAGICGVVGLWALDMLRNWNTMERAFVRLFFFGVLILAFLSTFFLQRGKVSNYSHLGGFLCGLCPAILMQRHLGHERLDFFALLIGGFTSLFLVVFLPAYFYSVTYVKAQGCPRLL
jgi:rhomboid protease GluP